MQYPAKAESLCPARRTALHPLLDLHGLCFLWHRPYHAAVNSKCGLHAESTCTSVTVLSCFLLFRAPMLSSVASCSGAGWIWYTYGRSSAFMWMSQGLSRLHQRELLPPSLTPPSRPRRGIVGSFERDVYAQTNPPAKRNRVPRR